MLLSFFETTKMLVGFTSAVLLWSANRWLQAEAGFKSLRLHEGHEARRSAVLFCFMYNSRKAYQIR